MMGFGEKIYFLQIWLFWSIHFSNLSCMYVYIYIYTNFNFYKHVYTYAYVYIICCIYNFLPKIYQQSSEKLSLLDTLSDSERSRERP